MILMILLSAFFRSSQGVVFNRHRGWVVSLKIFFDDETFSRCRAKAWREYPLTANLKDRRGGLL